LTETLYLDQQLALVDLMFVYFDKMSMATSLEVRVPFADHDVVRVCMSFGDDRKISRGRRKVILKRISDGLVDEEIINKRKRAFFRGASSTWLRTNTAGLVRETLLGERALSRGFLNAGAVDRALSTMAGGKRDNEGLLGLFMLEYWHQQFVDSDGFARRRVRDIRRATKHATI
jgi:asparagine synthase (glutamine-hydrolysing)